MTVNEFIHFLIPFLGVFTLVIVIIIGIQIVQILIRIKRMIERVETISDITGWVSVFKKLLSKKRSS